MRSLLIILLITLFFGTSYGQGEFNLYSLNRTVPQAHQLNPAFFSDAKVVVGLPGISSMRAAVDLDKLSFNHLFLESSEQSFSLDAESISAQLRDKNNFSLQSDLQLFFFGINIRNNFFSLAVNERINNWMVYSKDIADLALFGNGDERTFGRNLSLDKMLLRQNLYHEIALGFATNINKKFSVGARLKFLTGVLNAQTEQINGFVRTDSDSIHITNSDLTFRNSGYNYFSDDEDLLSLVQNTLPFTGGNSGFGIDLGAQYQITDRINLSASVIDLGYINWKENTEQYNIDGVTYSFRGFDVIDLIDNDGSGNNFLDQELDSLENLFTTEEMEGIAYKSSLVSNFYAGIDYQLIRNHHVGAQLYGKMAEGNIAPEFGAYYNLRVGRVLNTVINASFRNGKVHAAGAGVSLNLGPFHIYGTTESITNLITPQAANMMDARVGINLTFGRKKKPGNQTVAENEEEVKEPTEEIAAVPEEVETEEVVEEIAQNTSPDPVVPVEVPVEAPVQDYHMPLEEEAFDIPEKIEEPEVTIVQQGDHKDELSVGHYIVVGAFLSRMNAQNYSIKLKEKGYNNEFGFLTEKDFYYVTVYKNSGDIEKAREIRNAYRKKKDFLFPDTWLLSVVE